MRTGCAIAGGSWVVVNEMNMNETVQNLEIITN